MQSIYKMYKCKRRKCRKEMILPTEDIRKAQEEGKYLVCAYCGCKDIENIKETDDLKSCFKSDEKKR
ncbi:hypothetical protein [Clostridium sp.]|uniref:hypothetical protein n=1 Tax=Clostridium sp. TaxID=1506 RepID=UPI00261A75D5|nr:hypothetical protein [Clostridium sp.]